MKAKSKMPAPQRAGTREKAERLARILVAELDGDLDAVKALTEMLRIVAKLREKRRRRRSG